MVQSGTILRVLSLRLPQEFGKVLRKHRVRKNWSQMRLAQEAGLHLNALGNLERGERSPTLHTVFMLSEALELLPSELVAEVDERLRRDQSRNSR